MFITGCAVGLVIGWNFLPQPKFVADLVEKYLTKYFPTKK